MYYDNSKMLSHNMLFNYVVGSRGGGKTFNAKEWCIRDFVKTGKQFIWVRRYKTEFQRIKQFFADIAFKFPDLKMEVKGSQFIINDKVAGWAIPLSTSKKEKSTAFPDVNKIIYDEFIIDVGTYHYLKNEVEIFLEFYETVARIRDDVRVMFISNAITMINPYFTYFGIKMKEGAKFTKGMGWIVEMYSNDEFRAKKRETRFGKMIDNTEYGAYNIDNKFLRDSDEFIERPSGDLRYWCTILYNGVDYGVWFSPSKGTVYVSRKHDLSAGNRFCFTTDDHQPNVLLLKSVKYLKVIRRIKEAYELSLVRFDELKTKAAFYDYMKLL